MFSTHSIFGTDNLPDGIVVRLPKEIHNLLGGGLNKSRKRNQGFQSAGKYKCLFSQLVKRLLEIFSDTIIFHFKDWIQNTETDPTH